MEPSNGACACSAKILRPRTNRPYLRQRLFQRLDELRQVPVTWLIGAPGAGKTTLISSYLAARGLDGIWIQLDDGDADAATFFYYLGLAIQQASAHDIPTLPTLMPGHHTDLTDFSRRYANAAGAHLDLPAAIVLDNYEHIPAKAPLHDAIRGLISSLPEKLRLIVISRTAPPPAYSRMQLYRDLVTVEGRELNLTRDEALEFAAADHTRIDRILEETQGWFAGFTLLLTEGNDGSVISPRLNGKNQQLLFDYFATELFEHFPPDVQSALLSTALMPVMTVADAEHLSGNATIGTILADLHRQNCFLAQRGAEAHLYEYHTLFRAFLLNRAAAQTSLDEWRGLQCRAADLLAKSAQPEAAAGLYRAAQDWQGLAALALQEAAALVSAGRHGTLTAWLIDLPADITGQSPWIQYWRATACLPFLPVAAREKYAQAYAGFQLIDDAPGLYSTWVGAMETFFFEWRDFRPADHWIAEFERLRMRHPVFPSRAIELRTYWAMGTLLHRQPQHPMLPAWAERAQLLLAPSDIDLSVQLGGYLIIWFLWRGEPVQARGIIDRISPWTCSDMSPMVLILWQCAVGLYHSVNGDAESCLLCISSGLALAQQSGLHAFDFLLAAQMARCCLITGDPDAADIWIARMSNTMRHHSHIDGAFFLHLRCNAALQRNNREIALTCADSAIVMAKESGVPFLEAHCHLDLARVLPRCGDDAAFQAHIHAARVIGQSMGSHVIEYQCLETEAWTAFKQGNSQLGQEYLARALALSRTMDGATYQVAGPQTCIDLYDRALTAGVAIEHVQDRIRRQRLAPADPAVAAELWPWPIRIYTLGRFEILCDGQPLRPSGKPQHKPIELLKCLCAFGGQAVNQDRVTDALWPDASGDAADQVLRTTLHRLRKLLRHEQAIRLESRHLHLDPRYAWSDCRSFDDAAHHLSTLDKTVLKRVHDRYRGPFLHGESAHWALAYRARLRAQFLSMASFLGDLLEQEKDHAGAIECYIRTLEAEPLAEEIYRRLMHAYASLGQRAEAMMVYQRCRHALSSGLGISPTQETLALYQQLRLPSVPDP